MSLGYAGHARLEVEDDEIAIYSYTGENWNVRDEGVRSALESEEGQFTISKSCLIELAMHRKVERLSDGGKGRVEKAIVKNPDRAGDDGPWRHRGRQAVRRRYRGVRVSPEYLSMPAPPHL